jgi:Glutathione synthase/Ribosomal protein S6 modification enzyme (glutaminyl transferase)
MARHIIIVDRRADFPYPAPNRIVVAAKDFVAEAARELPTTARVINLCRDYSYLSLGYYCSLLAEARGQKVIPSVEVMLDLHWKRLLRIALPEVNELLRRTFEALPNEQPPFQSMIFFGVPDDPRLSVAARRIFELFRCPLLTIELKYRGGWQIASIEPASLADVAPEQSSAFAEALDRYTRVAWRAARNSPPVRYSIAILHDPQEQLPPSDGKALERFVRAGAHMGLEVELITRADYGRLLEFDALLIRETTALDHHTYRFAKKAEAEGIPVIDDPQSILRCTNKIYLAELLQAHDIPIPRTLILGKRRIGRVERELGFPAVIKIPDGSFSRGVFKVGSAEALRTAADETFRDSDLIIAQEYMSTPFDWRIGVLDRKPLYACQYFMAPDHWQIVKHGGGHPIAGASRTLALDAVPPAVIDVATRAAGLIGGGLYGVDLKQTDKGVHVIEINDNPSIDVGVEDAVLKDGLYRSILASLVQRVEKRVRPRVKPGGGVDAPVVQPHATADVLERAQPLPPTAS